MSSSSRVVEPGRVEPIVVDTGTIRLSGLVSRPQDTPVRGLIVALHGGGSSCGYWHSPLEGQSFLDLAARFGFVGLALDRPGYGASHDHTPSELRLAKQADDVFDAIDAWSMANGFNGKVFLIGHSIGGILALMMAAHPRAAGLGGVDVLGVPFRFPDSPGGETVHAFSMTEDYAAVPSGDTRRFLLFGPEGSYPPQAIEETDACVRPMPVAEYQDGLAAPSMWARVLPAIRRPVQFTLAEFETMQCTGWDILDEVRGLLSHSPGARVHLQVGSGHNASLHHIARAYHMRAIAYFEECLALQRL